MYVYMYMHLFFFLIYNISCITYAYTYIHFYLLKRTCINIYVYLIHILGKAAYMSFWWQQFTSSLTICSQDASVTVRAHLCVLGVHWCMYMYIHRTWSQASTSLCPRLKVPVFRYSPVFGNSDFPRFSGISLCNPIRCFDWRIFDYAIAQMK